MMIFGPIASTLAMVTRFFCPKESAEIGQLRKGYSPQILSVSSTFSRISASLRQERESPSATSS